MHGHGWTPILLLTLGAVPTPSAQQPAAPFCRAAHSAQSTGRCPRQWSTAPDTWRGQILEAPGCLRSYRVVPIRAIESLRRNAVRRRMGRSTNRGLNALPKPPRTVNRCPQPRISKLKVGGESEAVQASLEDASGSVPLRGEVWPGAAFLHRPGRQSPARIVASSVPRAVRRLTRPCSCVISNGSPGERLPFVRLRMTQN